MTTLLTALIICFSTVKCEYGQPFTAFHPAQQDYVQKQHHPGFGQSNHPLIQGQVDLNIKPVLRRRPQNDFGLPERQLNILEQPSFPFNSGNLLEQATAHVESAKSIFKALGNDTQANQILEHVFETSDCLDNVQDAIELMEESLKLINENGPEILYLDALADSLEDETNITTIILASAKMIRIFDDLLPKLSIKSSNLCISSPKDSVKAFKRLAHAMIDLKNNRNLPTDDISRQLLDRSSKIMSEVAKFLETLNKSLSSENLCEDGKRKGFAVYNSIENIMGTLASLFKVLGYEDQSKDIRKQGDFVKKIVNAFSDIDELKDTLECGKTDSFSNLALTLEDLAEIVQSVGIEALSKELGIDLNFIDEF